MYTSDVYKERDRKMENRERAVNPVIEEVAQLVRGG
jgi:hypothetical protein